MAFDISAGLSNAGAAVAKTAGDAVLESQKADLEKEKVILADQLAGVREDKQRGFLTSERVAGQEYMSGEKGLDRANAEKLATIQADAVIKGHSISAGAAMYSADRGLEGHKYAVDASTATADKLHDLNLRLGTKVIPGENGTLAVMKPGDSTPTPVTNPDGTPFKSTDPEMLKGQVAILNGAYKERQDLNYVFKQQWDTINSQINVLTKTQVPGMTPDPAVQRQVDALKSEAQKVLDQYKRDATELQLKIDGHVDSFFNRKNLPNPAAVPPASTSPRITPKPGGLVNSAPEPVTIPPLDQFYRQ